MGIAMNDRLQKLQTSPILAHELEVMTRMTRLFCAKHHGSPEGLCPKCRDFLAYATKRLACCPYGEDKPVCGKCKIHCYKPQYRQVAKDIMRSSGPQLLWHHPMWLLEHLQQLRKPAPDKPRNVARPQPPKPKE